MIRGRNSGGNRDSIQETKCAHLGCGCVPEPGSSYCSVQCENAGDGTDCGCGHPDCEAEA
jgi:hypothetical protein